MLSSQDIKDTADSLAFAKNGLAAQTPIFEAKNAEVVALVTTERAALDAAQLAYDNAVAAARVTTGWQPVSAAYDDAVITVANAIDAHNQMIAEYDGL